MLYQKQDTALHQSRIKLYCKILQSYDNTPISAYSSCLAGVTCMCTNLSDVIVYIKVFKEKNTTRVINLCRQLQISEFLDLSGM